MKVWVVGVTGGSCDGCVAGVFDNLPAAMERKNDCNNGRYVCCGQIYNHDVEEFELNR